MLESLPHTSDLLQLAERYVWFKQPHETLNHATHFIAYVLTYGLNKDIKILRRYVTNDQLREALHHAPPGVFDARSWAYWHLRLGFDHPPPLPKRDLDSLGYEHARKTQHNRSTGPL